MLYNQNLQLENVLKIWNQVYLRRHSLNKNIQAIYLSDYSPLIYFFTGVGKIFPTIIKRKTKFNQVYKYEARFKLNLDYDPIETKKNTKIDLKELNRIREIIEENIAMLQNNKNALPLDEILGNDLKKIALLVKPFFNYFKLFLKFIVIGFLSPIKILKVFYICFHYFYTGFLRDTLVMKKQKYINFYYKHIYTLIPNNYKLVIEIIYPFIKIGFKIISPIVLIIETVHYHLKLIFTNISIRSYICRVNTIMYKMTFLFLISFYIILLCVYFDLFDLIFTTIKNNYIIQIMFFIIPIIYIITKKTYTIKSTILKRLTSFTLIFHLTKLIDLAVLEIGQPIKKKKLVHLLDFLEKFKLGANNWIYEKFVGIPQFSRREHAIIKRFNNIDKGSVFKTPLFTIKDFSTIFSYLTWSFGKLIKIFLAGLKGKLFVRNRPGWKRKRILRTRGYFIHRYPKAPNYLVIEKKFNTVSPFCNSKTGVINHINDYTFKNRTYFQPWRHIFFKEVLPIKHYLYKKSLREYKLIGGEHSWKWFTFPGYKLTKYRFKEIFKTDFELFENITYSNSVSILLAYLILCTIAALEISPLLSEEEDIRRNILIKNHQELLEEHENYFDWSQNNFINFSFFFNRTRHELRYPLGGSELEIDENNIENHFFCVDTTNKMEDDMTISTKVKIPFKNYFWDNNLLLPLNYNDQAIDLSYNEKLLDTPNEFDIDEITEYSDVSFIINEQHADRRIKNIYKLFCIRRNMTVSNTKSYTHLNKSLIQYVSKTYQIQHNITTILNEYLVDTTDLDTPSILEPEILDPSTLCKLESLLNDQNNFIYPVINRIKIEKYYSREKTKLLNKNLKNHIDLLISLYDLGNFAEELPKDGKDLFIPFIGGANFESRNELIKYFRFIEICYNELHPLEPKEKYAILRYLEILEKFKEKPYYSITQQTIEIMGINLIKSEDPVVTNYAEDLIKKKYKKL